MHLLGFLEHGEFRTMNQLAAAYWVGQINRGHYTFLLVTNEYLPNFMTFGTYKLHKAKNGATSIL